MTVATSIMTGGMVAGIMTGVADATAGAEAAACAGAGDGFAGTDVEPGIPAAGTGQQTIKFFRSPTRGPAYANGPAAKGDASSFDNKAVEEAITAALIAGDTEALVQHVQSVPSDIGPHSLVAIVKAAADAANEKINAPMILRTQFGEYLRSYSDYTDDRYMTGRDITEKFLKDRLQDSPELGIAFWETLAAAIKDMHGERCFDENLGNVRYIYKGLGRKARTVLVNALVSHVIEKPGSWSLSWVKSHDGTIWNRASTKLAAMARERKISPETLAKIMSVKGYDDD